MQTLSRDTSPKAEKVLVELLRESPAWRKFQMIEDCNRFVQEAMLEGIRERHPVMTEAELRRKLADIWLGEELAARAYGSTTEH